MQVENEALREKCPNTEIRKSPLSVRMQENMDQK